MMRNGRTGTPSTSSGSRPARNCRHERRDPATGGADRTSGTAGLPDALTIDKHADLQRPERKLACQRGRMTMSFLTTSVAVLLATTAAAAAVGLVPTPLAAQPATARTATEDTAIRPFRVNIPEEALVELRRRIAATRWPDQETVADQSQGIQLAKIRPLVEHW